MQWLRIAVVACAATMLAAGDRAEAAQKQFNFSLEKPGDAIRYGGTPRAGATEPSSNAAAETARRRAPASQRSTRRSQRMSYNYGARSTSYGGKQTISYSGPHKPGTIIVKTGERRLYYVLPGGRAIQYGIGVGRQGFTWRGRHRVSRKAEWPGWTPPAAMRKRQPNLPAYMPGGPNNPLGARALYIGSTLYRIHGTNQAWSIGRAVSSGCIRMLNEEVIDLYNRIRIGALVVVQ